MYIDCSHGGNTLSLPKEIGVRDGRLCALYTPLVQKLRQRQTTWIGREEALELLPTSFAWRTFGGRSHSLSDGYEIETNAFDYQGALLPQKVRGVEMSFRLAADAVGAGAMLGLYDENGYLRYPLFVSIESSRQRLILCKGYGFEYVCAREYPFQQGQTYFIRLIVTEGVCEVYINDVLLLQCGVETGPLLRYGFFCDRGKASFTHVEAYELES